MRLRTRLVAGTLSLLALGVASARLFAEDLDLAKLLDGAKAACAEKRYGQALQDLQLVVGEVGRLRMEGLKALLPAAPAGWTAEAAEGTANAAMLGMGTTVRRSYRKGDGVTASMELVADASILLSGLQMMLANPA